MNIGIEEKIETIVDCFLRRGTAAGKFGAISRIDQFTYRVIVEGKTFIVTSTAGGWRVEFNGSFGQGAYVIEAAMEALRAARTKVMA